MTDPGMADCHLSRAAECREPGADHRQGAAGRRPAQPRRPDRAEPDLRAAQTRNTGEVRREDHRRPGGRHRARRRPYRLQGDDEQLGIEMPRSEPAYSVEEAEKIAQELGYPVVVRPAYTMGGTGGGIVYNVEELRTIVARGIAASLVGQVLIEESVLGWEELELEVVRDAKNKMITVCFIENVDAMGVHTGDSYCVAPMLTVPKELQAAAAGDLLPDRRGHRRHRRHEYPVRARPEDRPRGGHRDQPAHVTLFGAGLQGDRLSHRAHLLQARRRPDAGRDSLLARRHAGEIHAVRATTSSSSSPAGHSRSSPARSTNSARRCGPSAK